MRAKRAIFFSVNLPYKKINNKKMRAKRAIFFRFICLIKKINNKKLRAKSFPLTFLKKKIPQNPTKYFFGVWDLWDPTKSHKIFFWSVGFVGSQKSHKRQWKEIKTRKKKSHKSHKILDLRFIPIPQNPTIPQIPQNNFVGVVGFFRTIIKI